MVANLLNVTTDVYYGALTNPVRYVDCPEIIELSAKVAFQKFDFVKSAPSQEVISSRLVTLALLRAVFSMVAQLLTETQSPATRRLPSLLDKSAQ